MAKKKSSKKVDLEVNPMAILRRIEEECPSCPCCGEDWDYDGGSHLGTCEWELLLKTVGQLQQEAKGLECVSRT